MRFSKEGKEVIRVAIPSVASMAMETLLGFVDTFWVSRLGNHAVAAISASTYLLWVVYSLIDVVAVGLVSLAAYFSGRKDRENLSISFYTGFYSVLGLSFFLSAILLLNLPAYLSLFRLPFLSSLWLADYLFIQLIFLPIGGLYYLVGSVYEGEGKTKEVFYASLLVLGLNSVLDPILIFHFGLRLKGAALASAAARALGLAFLRRKLDLKTKGFSLTFLWRMVRIGIPSSVYWLTSTGVFTFLNALASRIEPVSVAAMGVGVRYETIPYIISMGISVGASSVIGRSRGREDKKAMKRAAVFSLRCALLISILIGAVFYSLAPQLSGFFLKGRSREIASLYLKISSLSQIFFSLTIVYEGIFVGLGKTFPPLAFGIGAVLLRIPLAFLHHSLEWIFLLFPLTNFLATAVYWLYLREFLGRWKLRKC